MWQIPILVMICGMAAAAEQPAGYALMTEVEKLSARAAEARGELIYLHDRAAWIGTDEVQRLKGFSRDKRLRGYVTERRGDETRVTFFGHAEGGPDMALYRVVIADSAKPAEPATALSEPEALSEYEAGAVRARNLAMTQPLAACSKTYNTVVLPVIASGEEQWVVYLLPGSTERNVIPMGGAYRMEINQAASGVLSQRAFTKTCIRMENKSNAAALVITHLMDPMPTEVHVFWSLSARKPLYVMTTENSSIWVVEGTTIRKVERESESEGATEPK